MRKPLTVGQRLSAEVFKTVTKLLVGYTPDFFDELIATMGVAGFMKWSGHLDKVMKDLDAQWGHAVGQVLVGAAAMWNGCQYCGVGHTFAGNLAWFREHGSLLPFSERDVPRLQRMTDDDARQELRRMFAEPQYQRLSGLLERLYALKYEDVQPATAQDELLQRTIAAWDLVNECSILSAIEPNEVEPLSPISKDKTLIARYLAAREG